MNIKQLILLFSLITSLNAYALPTAKVTVRVTNEKGQVIENAKVGIGVSKPKSRGQGTGSDVRSLRGVTDTDGLFTGEGSTEPYVGIGVQKEGYYKTTAHYDQFTGFSGFTGFRKWKPWNPIVEVVLKKIKKPIPMYVADIQGKASPDAPPAKLPEEGKFFGFDLIAKDWVIPYGQGLHSDFIFKVNVDHFTRKPLVYDATMVLKFTNPDDGIQSFYVNRKRGSAFRSAHHAPLTGYQDKLVTRRTREEGKILKTPYLDDQNYYFRIRTKRDDQGNIIEAHYGKIYDNIIFSLPQKQEKAKLYFSYYLNPNNNDTNIEFASEKNLFPKPDGHRGRYWFNP